MPRITLRQVAERAGLSAAAVSQALNHTGNMSAKTRERVQKIATEMGYIPNPVLSSLAANHFKNKELSSLVSMGLIIPEIDSVPYYTEQEHNSTVAIYRSYARNLGYELHVWTIDQIQDWNAFARMLYHRGISGVVIYPKTNTVPELSSEWNRFATVIANNNPRYNHFNLVYVDHFELVQRAWREVLAQGYKRIGWVIMRHQPEIHDDMIRRAAARECVAATHRKYRIPVLWDAVVTDTTAVSDWYRAYKPEVIVGFHVGVAWRLIIEDGMRVPEDFSFVNLHNDKSNETIFGLSIAGLSHMDNKVLTFAIDQMDQMIRHRMYGFNSLPRKVLINANWEPGQTCPSKVAQK